MTYAAYYLIATALLVLAPTAGVHVALQLMQARRKGGGR